eukprot:scaffold805_cov251-Pinguiococcus_pyrenoidosus.AAC.5
MAAVFPVEPVRRAEGAAPSTFLALTQQTLHRLLAELRQRLSDRAHGELDLRSARAALELHQELRVGHRGRAVVVGLLPRRVRDVDSEHVVDVLRRELGLDGVRTRARLHHAGELGGVRNLLPRRDEGVAVHGPRREDRRQVELQREVHHALRRHVLQGRLDVQGRRSPAHHLRRARHRQLEVHGAAALQARAGQRQLRALSRARRDAEGVVVELDGQVLRGRRAHVGEGKVEHRAIGGSHEAGRDRDAAIRAVVHGREGRLGRGRRGAEAEGIRGRRRASGVHAEEVDLATLGLAAAAAGGGDDVFLFVFLLLVGEGHDGAHDEGLGRLVVHGAERRELRDHLVEEARLQSEGVVGDGRLLREHHGAGRVRVGAEQAPVDEATVTEIRVVGLFRGHREHALHELLRLLRVLQEELHRGGEQLELHAGRLLVEGLEEGLHELIGVVDALGVLADDPDHGGLGLGLVERLEVLAEGGDDLLVAVRVAAEDVLDHDDRLLHDVVDARLDELEKHGDAALRGALELDGAAADGAHGAAHEVHVDLRGVLLELEQHLVDVRLADQADHDLQLLQLDVDGVVVLAEEDLDLVLQDLRALLHDEVDVAQGDVLHFRLAVDERHERRRQLAAQQADGLVVGHRVHVRQDHLDRRHNDGGVRVLEARRDTLDDGLGLAGGLRHILGQRVEDEHLAPLGALVQRGEELLEHRRRNQHHVRLRGLGDLAERGHAVGHHLKGRQGVEQRLSRPLLIATPRARGSAPPIRSHRRVGVADELAELVDEATVLHELRADVVELGHADGGGLAHVGILVAKRPSQGLQQILGDPLHANAAHGANRERADQRVGVRSVLHSTEAGEEAKRTPRRTKGEADPPHLRSHSLSADRTLTKVLTARSARSGWLLA